MTTAKELYDVQAEKPLLGTKLLSDWHQDQTDLAAYKKAKIFMDALKRHEQAAKLHDRLAELFASVSGDPQVFFTLSACADRYFGRVLTAEQEAALAASRQAGSYDVEQMRRWFDRLPVPMSMLFDARSRGMHRTLRAKLLRKMFTKLGLKGISVKVPSYSMARTVDVEIPARIPEAYVSEASPMDQRDPAFKLNRGAVQCVEILISVLFPDHNDRSDSRSDYFDYCWSVECNHP